MKLKIINFEKGTTFLADEHAIVNDDEFCEIMETASSLTYELEGFGEHSVSQKGASKEELIKMAVKNAIFDVWFEDHMYDSFADVGLTAPIVQGKPVADIDDFINNCNWILSDDEFNRVKQQLIDVAVKEVDMIVEDV
ncbi:MAG: hypothetical protein IJH63_10215 [Methanobrevibacter sp.]|nr:hypothetical protein [Methanosphaera sp.]MBR0371073.1 hypothetical protein [Methanobrevibacter sp.]